MEGNAYELLEKFMESLEVQKECLSKELEEKDKIIEAQEKKELSQQQKIIDKEEKLVANLKVHKLKIKEGTFTIIKQRQIRLIACSKKILNAGAAVAEASLHYMHTILMVQIDTKEDEHEETAITYNDDSPTKDEAVGGVADASSIRILDQENIVAAEKEWEKETADKSSYRAGRGLKHRRL